MMQLPVIQNKIYGIRNVKVMLDFDRAGLYQVETKVFNQAVKRNLESFPSDFMFKLIREEWKSIRSQFVTTYSQHTDNEQNTTLRNTIAYRSKTYLPYAFTEHGVSMAAGILKSPVARKMNIAIVRAFIALRKMALHYQEIIEALKELRDRMGGYDTQLNQIYETLENMLDEQVQNKMTLEEWNERQRIGFNTKSENTIK